MKDVASYSYNPLPESHIRLLEIQNDSTLNSIRCRFQEHHIDQCPPYIALSYTWGLTSSNNNIILDGKKFTIRENLASFFQSLFKYHRKLYIRNPELKFLRSKPLPLLWIDQICINQKDLLERNHQVQMMNLVYAFASRVIAWLGPSNKPIETAFKYLRNRPPSPEADTDEGYQAYELYIAPALNDSEAKGLNEMFNRPYWTRLWILQELILAKQITLMCGEDGLDWSTLDRLPFASEEVKGNMNIHLPGQVHWNRSEWSKHGNRGRHMDRMFHLQALVEAFKRQQCSDDRDRVFGLLALHRRCNPQARVLEADYFDTKEEVYKKVLEYVGVESAYMNCEERFRFTGVLERTVLDVSRKDEIVAEATQTFLLLHPEFRLLGGRPAWCDRCLSPADQIKEAEAQESENVY